MEKILLKIYLKTLKYIGADIFSSIIIDNLLCDIPSKIHMLQRDMFNSDYSDYKTNINKIAEIKWFGYTFGYDVYDTIHEKIIEKYCIRNNISYEIFMKEYKSDISNIVEKRWIYYIILNLCILYNKISSSFIFYKYFQYKEYEKAIIEYVDMSLSGKNIDVLKYNCAKEYIRDDETGYLNDFYNNYLIYQIISLPLHNKTN